MSETQTNLSTRRQRESERLTVLHGKCPKTDHGFPFTGVLLSDGIKYCIDQFDLIRPFREENLKPANYKLTIGDQYAVEGKMGHLIDRPGEDEFVIEPFQVAVIKTRETINMPPFLIARWNIRVQLAYKGLLWVGGPQVDAGYVGYLFCPIYNLSDSPVPLKFGDPIAVIDFVRTSEFHEGESVPYAPVPPERVLFEDYAPKELKSAIYQLTTNTVHNVEQQLKELQESLEKDQKNYKERSEARIAGLQTRIDQFVVIVLSVLAVLFAAVTIFVTRSEQFSLWNPALFLISLTAISISILSWMKSDFRNRFFATVVQLAIVVFLVLAICYHIWSARPAQRQINDLRKEIELMKREKAPASQIIVAPNTETPVAEQQKRPVVTKPKK